MIQRLAADNFRIRTKRLILVVAVAASIFPSSAFADGIVATYSSGVPTVTSAFSVTAIGGPAASPAGAAIGNPVGAPIGNPVGGSTLSGVPPSQAGGMAIYSSNSTPGIALSASASTSSINRDSYTKWGDPLNTDLFGNENFKGHVQYYGEFGGAGAQQGVVFSISIPN